MDPLLNRWVRPFQYTISLLTRSPSHREICLPLLFNPERSPPVRLSQCSFHLMTPPTFFYWRTQLISLERSSSKIFITDISSALMRGIGKFPFLSDQSPPPFPCSTASFFLFYERNAPSRVPLFLPNPAHSWLCVISKDRLNEPPPLLFSTSRGSHSFLCPISPS